MLADTDDACFHCGEPLAKQRFSVEVLGRTRQTCCPGCQAACQTIVDLGLENYYRHRDTPANKAGDGPVPDDLFARFSDSALVDDGYIGQDADGQRECTLIIDDMRCAACGWLIEKSVGAMPGVAHAAVNVTSGRARVCWNPSEVELRDVMLRIRRLGYRALPFRGGAGDTRLDVERRASLMRLVVAGFGMMQVMHVAVGFYGDAAGSMSHEHRDYLRVISAFVTTPVVLYSGWPFLRNAWFSLRGGMPGMDVPVALAILLAYFASLWAVAVEGPEVWFDSVVMFVFFLLVGRHLEFEARRRAGRVVDNLSASLPLVATRIRDERADVVPASRLRTGDVVRVLAGETIPADGTVLAGNGHADESMLTGESRPVPRSAGDAVTGGCTSIDGTWRIRVTSPVSGGRLSRIVDLVHRAQMEKPALQDAADRIATHFVTVLLALTATTWIAWHFIDPSRAFWIALSVLVVSCPCALSLAMPAAYTVATNFLTGRGLLLTRASTIPMLGQLRTVVFDKTGTLTLGRPELAAIVPFAPISEPALRRLAAALEQESSHPMAGAFRRAATVGGGGAIAAAHSLRVVAGAGIEGEVDGTRCRIGTLDFVSDPAFLRVAPPQGLPTDMSAWIGTADGLLGAFRLSDAPRPDAAAVVARLRRQGIAVHLLSGDVSGEAHTLARRLDIPHVRAGALPEDKVAYVRGLREAGSGPVLMVGDGINDAPVLAAADASLAMGEGTDLARMAADGVLLRGSLELVPLAMATSQATSRTVRQNLGWAIAYNVAMVPLAAAGYMPPWLAALGMSLSSLLVVLNALWVERRALALYRATGAAQNPPDSRNRKPA